MAEIANAAGMAKSSIYTYFKNQEELYASIACQDADGFIRQLGTTLNKNKSNAVETAIQFFIEYYMTNEAQWRMITHFALHGKNDICQVDRLNDIGRKLIDVFETLIKDMGCKNNTRIIAHSLFACLSGILISFRNYPGRSEEQRLAHMKLIGQQIESMITVFVKGSVTI